MLVLRLVVVEIKNHGKQKTVGILTLTNSVTTVFRQYVKPSKRAYKDTRTKEIH